MAVAPQVSYPGVYIQEVDSGVRTITSVPTAITAFLGRTQRGPVNEPTLVTNIGQFATLFGGLAADMPLTYAIQDYYQNGGSLAIVVRLVNQPVPKQSAEGKEDADKKAADPPAASAGAAVAKDLHLIASSVGAWGNNLQIMVDRKGIDDELAKKFVGPDAKAADLFNLTVKDGSPGGSTERIQNVHLKEGRRRLDRVLSQQFTLGSRQRGQRGKASLERCNPSTRKRRRARFLGQVFRWRG